MWCGLPQTPRTAQHCDMKARHKPSSTTIAKQREAQREGHSSSSSQSDAFNMASPSGSRAKNPFEPKKETTVRRTREEAYPLRKGLNQPEYLGSSPLDRLFQDLEGILSGELDSIDLHALAPRLFPGSAEAQQQPESALRYAVVEKLLQYLLEIQQLSIEAHNKSTKKDLITISLHDLKTFGKLVNLIILIGVYPAISALKIGIPVEKRRLNSFGKPSYRALKVQPIQPAINETSPAQKYKQHSELLVLLYDKLSQVFFTESDARNLLMKGSGYSDFLVVAITLLTTPYFDTQLRSRVLAEFEHVCSIATTYELYQDYSLLVATPSPDFFKSFVMTRLQLLPYSAPKGDGVLTLIEFVLGLRDKTEIDVEKLDHVANVLLSKPKTVSAPEYFTSIGNQCYDLLVNINRPTITSCVCHFLDTLWTKNSRIVEDFFLSRVWQTFDPSVSPDKPVLVTEASVNNNVNVLLSLTNHGLSTELLAAAITPILIPFWSYYCFLRSKEKSSEVAQNILVSYFTQVSIEGNLAEMQLDNIIRDLVAELAWSFRLGPNLLVEIVSSERPAFSSDAPEQKVLQFMNLLDNNCNAFVDLVGQLEDTILRKAFIALLEKWVDGMKSVGGLADENPFFKLIDLRLLENIGDKFKERLAETPQDILQLVEKILKHSVSTASPRPSENLDMATNENPVDSDDEDEEGYDSTNSSEIITVVLELLSAIISETQPAELDEGCRHFLKSIQDILEESYQDMRSAQSLASRIHLILANDSAPSSSEELEARALKRAISHLNDPLAPIRAHGLYQLRQLVEQRSSVISVDFVVNLHLIQLKDTDPFVYLNAIKGLQSLLVVDDKEVLPVLLALYCGKSENASVDVAKKEEISEEATHNTKDGGPLIQSDLDERLRIGEVLLRYVQVQSQAFSGQLAQAVCHTALALIRRPSDDAQMVDNRLRMSAMSILGTCCNTNVIGILPMIKDALDCAIGVLDLETAKDSAILRRSAIVLIHDLILGTSKSDVVPFPRDYMEKVLVVLRFVQGHDNDMLVREQATSVLQYIDDLVQIAMSAEE